jgi:hypothetical protein
MKIKRTFLHRSDLMLPSKLKLVYCHNSNEIRKHLLCKVEVYYFKVTSILGRACDVTV